MTRCLITGVAGFIGSSLADHLSHAGYQVRGVDNLSTGNLANLEPCRARMDFHRGDIRDARLMTQLCQGVDVVFHQAAVASVQRSVDDPIDTFEINVNGTRTVLEAARRRGVRRFIFASSSAIYGDASRLPCAEDDNYKPLSPYAAHKLNGELMLQDRWLNGDIETVALRYFNVFGPRQSADSPYSGAIASFVKAMTAGRPATIFGDGLQTRDFVFIDDVVRANVKAMESRVELVGGYAFNIATGQARSVLETAHTIAGIVGFRGATHHAPARADEIKHSLADVRQARQLLGFSAATTFQRGLARTVAWMRQNGSQPELRVPTGMHVHQPASDVLPRGANAHAPAR